MAVASALVVLLLFCGVSECARLSLITTGVRDAVQETILSTVDDNYDGAYHDVREGYSGGYYPSGGDWDESLDYGDVYGFLNDPLGMEGYGSYYVKRVGGDRKEEYRISDLDVTIQNVSLASDNNERFPTGATFLLRAPIHFGGSRLPNMQIRMKVQAVYTPVF